MNYKIYFYLFCIFLITSCEQSSKKLVINDFNQKYKNSGFALIYNNDLYKNKKISKKISNRSLLIFHNTLKKKSLVKITNPMNKKSLIAEVASNKAKFSNFYNSVITQRIAEELDINNNEPYIQLVLISPNSSFIAKKTKTFDEEKKVAEKAPVDGIEIDNLSVVSNEIKTLEIKKILFYIKIADFYYETSANNMVKRIINETSLINHSIKKLSKTKYRVLLGPFNDIKKLEKSYNEIMLLGFDNLEILKNV